MPMTGDRVIATPLSREDECRLFHGIDCRVPRCAGADEASGCPLCWHALREHDGKGCTVTGDGMSGDCLCGRKWGR